MSWYAKICENASGLTFLLSLIEIIFSGFKSAKFSQYMQLNAGIKSILYRSHGELMKKNGILKMNTTKYRVDLDKAVDVYSDMVYRIAMSYVKNSTDAQDIFQNTFLKLTRYKDTIESEEHLRAWLIKVSVNCAKSFVTSTWNKTTEGLDLETINEPVFMMEEQSELYELILALDDKYKMPLLLYYYEGYSVKEIARILDEKENTIKSNLSRGRKKLKNDIESKM